MRCQQQSATLNYLTNLLPEKKEKGKAAHLPRISRTEELTDSFHFPKATQ